MTRLSASLLLAALLASGQARAADPEPFALAFPLQVADEAPLFQVELTPEVYATLTRLDRSDLAVVDAEGRRLALVLRSADPTAVAEQRRPLPVPLRLPARLRDTPGALALRLRQAGNGAELAVDLRAEPRAGEDREEWLLDTVGGVQGDQSGPIDGLRFDVPEAVGDLRLALEVWGSDDLVDWRPLRTSAPLLRVGSGEARIQRLDIDLPRTTLRYLALRPPAGQALPAITGIEAIERGDALPTRRLHVLTAEAATDGRRFDYPAPGPLPLVAVELQLAERNAVNGFRLWRGSTEAASPLLAGHAWRLEFAGTTLFSTPIPARLSGHGPLRIELDTPAAAPALGLWYHPEHLLVLASGRPPYRLLAGSGSERGRFEGAEAAIAALQAAQPAGWTPPSAMLGAPEVLGGAGALAARAPRQTGKTVLWGVLVLGALLVGGASWRALRQPPAAPAD